MGQGAGLFLGQHDRTPGRLGVERKNTVLRVFSLRAHGAEHPTLSVALSWPVGASAVRRAANPGSRMRYRDPRLAFRLAPNATDPVLGSGRTMSPSPTPRPWRLRAVDEPAVVHGTDHSVSEELTARRKGKAPWGPTPCTSPAVR